MYENMYKKLNAEHVYGAVLFTCFTIQYMTSLLLIQS